ncbi:MAG: hypothetical protein HYS13_23850 [Planctomycetia bacterium]|nr:hypothetical protein [Planctomycetia bacterium]
MRLFVVASTFLAVTMLATSPVAHPGGIARAGEPKVNEPAKTYLVTVAVSGMS